MQTLNASKPLALRNLQRVDMIEQKSSTPVNEWNWTPSVSNPEKLNNIVASGSNTTTRNTFSSQQDHGENY